MDKSIIVPIGLFVSVVYTIKLLVDARMRYLFFKGDAPDTVEALYRGEERARRLGTLRWGVVLVFLAAALGWANLMGWHPWSLQGVALLIGALGVGNLSSFVLAGRLAVAEQASG